MGDVYLHAQIFAGFMYIGAAICMWFLRAWKVGDIRQLAAGQEKPIIGVSTQIKSESAPARHTEEKNNIYEDLFAWKRV